MGARIAIQFTEKQIKDVNEMILDRKTLSFIADKYHCSKESVVKVVNRPKRKHIAQPGGVTRSLENRKTFLEKRIVKYTGLIEPLKKELELINKMLAATK